ncbi:hypothetical protein ACQI4F_05820 [Mycolicibacterium vaccae]|uniref:hypothetical protein n=1 Tax=Mycolicibacterium vaccae TaxID=1810 RepID=UPI003CE80A97
MLAIAGAVGTVAGAINVVVPVGHWVAKKFEEEKVGLLSRSQNLGFEIWQEKQSVDLYEDSSSGQASYRSQRAQLVAAPFELRFPKKQADLGIRIVAWTDRSIFAIEQDKAAETIGTNQWFGFGRGMADTTASSGTLMLANDGFMYFIGDRAAEISPQQVAVYFNSYADATASTFQPRPMGALNGKHLYFSLWVDDDDNRIVENGEYEFLTLDF